MPLTHPRVVLISGASTGIGQASAERLSAVGHRVYGTSRNPSGASSGFTMLRMDVTSDDSVDQAVATVVGREGRLDVVVNNAGFGLAGSIEDTSNEEAKLQFEANFFGVLRLTRAALPHMRDRGSGLIVNVSSLAGVFGVPFQGLYVATKFAMEGLTESLRQEVRPFGVCATLIEPGDVKTSITRNRVVSRRAAIAGPYEPWFARALACIQHDELTAGPPSLVADLLVKILSKRWPRVRYTVGRRGQTLAAVAKRWLPSGLFERIIMSHYGISGRVEPDVNALTNLRVGSPRQGSS